MDQSVSFHAFVLFLAGSRKYLLLIPWNRTSTRHIHRTGKEQLLVIIAHVAKWNTTGVGRPA